MTSNSKRLLTISLLGAAVCVSATLGQEETNLAVDPGQTKVDFTVHSLVHTVHGTFVLKRGALVFNPATGKASGELVVDAASGNSGSDARDSRMRKEILEVQKYPEIRFRPDRIEGAVAPAGASDVKLHGIFSIHGADHEMTVPAQVQANGGMYAATALFEVPYISWGMKNPSTLFLRVSDTVQITVHTVARPAN
jgi:polyisoprenoid-binding protein YceI